MCFRKDYSAEYKLVLRLINESDEVPEMASQPNLSQALRLRRVLSLAKEGLTLGNQNKETGQR